MYMFSFSLSLSRSSFLSLSLSLSHVRICNEKTAVCKPGSGPLTSGTHEKCQPLDLGQPSLQNSER